MHKKRTYKPLDELLNSLSNLSNTEIYPSATSEDIDIVLDSIGVELPEIYQLILFTSNGFLTEDGIYIYGTDDVVERNETWEVQQYAPGYIAIGDDSGGRILLMPSEFDATHIILVDCGDMNPDNAIIIASDVMEWISDGCQIVDDQSINDDSFSALKDIILISPLEGGIKDLLRLKTKLNLEMPASDLLKGSRAIPFTLLRKISEGKAQSLLFELGDLQDKIKLISSEL